MKEEEGLPSAPQSQARVVVSGRTLYKQRLGDKTPCTWCPTPRMEGRTFRRYFVQFPQSPAQYLARNRDTCAVMTWCPRADGLEAADSSCPAGLRGCLFEGSPKASHRAGCEGWLSQSPGGLSGRSTSSWRREPERHSTKRGTLPTLVLSEGARPKPGTLGKARRGPRILRHRLALNWTHPRRAQGAAQRSLRS